MLFTVEADIGFLLKGYSVPDAYDGYCNLALRSGGKTVAVIPATGRRDLPLIGGRHLDSHCGFYIDESQVAGLSLMDDLELRDEDTGVLLYRRRRPEHVEAKVLRLETHLFPLWRIDSAMNGMFQYWSPGIERYGRETLLQMLVLNYHNSAYLSGRLLFRTIRQYVDEVFRVLFIMHHPYEELAERLIVLRQADHAEVLSDRDASMFAPVVGFARALPIDDEKQLARALRQTPREVGQILANPVTRMLTCQQFEELPGSRALTSALDALSSFEIVGLRRASGSFVRALAQFLNTPAASLPSIQRLASVTELAKTLKRTRAFEGLLELDLQLYGHIAEAYRNIVGNGEAAPSLTAPERL